MSTPELGDRNYNLSNFPSTDQEFFEKALKKLDDRPLARKIRGAIPKILLASSVVTLALGAILSSKEIFAGGVFLGSLWHQFIDNQPF